MEKEILGEGGKFEEGREIVDKVNAEENAWELIALVRARVESGSGSGIEMIDEGKFEGGLRLAKARGRAKKLMQQEGELTQGSSQGANEEVREFKDFCDLHKEADRFFNIFSEYLSRHPEIDGKGFLDYFSHEEREGIFLSFLDRSKEVLEKTDWGKILLKVRGYWDKIEYVKTPEGGAIRIEKCFSRD